jgi:isochorismate synthase
MSSKHLREEHKIINREWKQQFSAVFQYAVQAEKPTACWRLPGDTEKRIIIDITGSQNFHTNLEDQKPGFLINPFKEFSGKGKFIQADILLSSEKKSDSYTQTFLKDILGKGQVNTFAFPKIIQKHTPQNEGEKKYSNIVDLAIQKIQEGVFKKVVLSRSKNISHGMSNPMDAFALLCERYPNSFISLIYHPEEGIWLGASPELLVAVDEQNIFKTVALAGTQSVQDKDNLSKANWTQKEIEEQALVSRYIINCFKTIRLREFEEEGPSTIKAGNLLHLQTEFSVNMKEINMPDLGSVMLKLLHPTSAVCGMPKEDSLQFINAHELLERKLFSGYLGPVNIQNNTQLYVNLRCAQLFADKATLYAGAGITKDSIAENEWKETELKMSLMEEILNAVK